VLLEEVSDAAEFLLSKTRLRPQIAVICGSGISHLSNALTDTQQVDYKDIPHFTCPTGTLPLTS